MKYNATYIFEALIKANKLLSPGDTSIQLLET